MVSPACVCLRVCVYTCTYQCFPRLPHMATVVSGQSELTEQLIVLASTSHYTRHIVKDVTFTLRFYCLIANDG